MEELKEIAFDEDAEEEVYSEDDVDDYDEDYEDDENETNFGSSPSPKKDLETRHASFFDAEKS